MNFVSSDITPLGATYNEETKCVDFRLYSKNAHHVILCIFNSPQGEDAVMNLEMKKNENNIFETSVKNYVLNCHKFPVYYGYRLFGANWVYDKDFRPGSDIGFKSKTDEYHNRFNPNKLAFDPYSQEISHLPSDVNPNLNIFRSGANFHLIDDAKWAPKSVFFPKNDKIIEKIEARPFVSEVIGEVHVKDLTQMLNMQERGTYLGAKNFAHNIKNLGITMVEFLPINEYDSRQCGFNHWGYMPLAWFSLARRYAFNKMYGNLLNEFRSMVDEFHKNGIKICLDMVFNHTGEGANINDDADDAVGLSYALIDNEQYYKTKLNGLYRSHSGCGNDVNIGQESVQELISDCLAFWVNQGVDAFRFDLAAHFLEDTKNEQEHYDTYKSFAFSIRQKLQKRGVMVADDFTKAQEGIVLIAEPWTCCAKETYKIGAFPSFWAEWNDISRDTLRKLTMRPNELAPLHIRNIMEGTPSKFKREIRALNYIACHDGFSLYDLNTYSRKAQTTSGGSDWEICSDYNSNPFMIENAIRKQLAFLFVLKGIPMVQIGDIIMHTKMGNNNTYDHDDDLNYLDWSKALERGSFENKIMELTRHIIDFRQSHKLYEAKILGYFYNNGQIAPLSNEGYWKNTKDNFFGVLFQADKKIYVINSKADYPIDYSLVPLEGNKKWMLV
ncbi:hypothetical protein IJ670_05280, partial [bacterium]|nr:hypothetical protein [bacterium]